MKDQEADRAPDDGRNFVGSYVREENYLCQGTGRSRLTPRQRRRVHHKFNRNEATC